jgi:hypothetical protein
MKYETAPLILYEYPEQVSQIRPVTKTCSTRKLRELNRLQPAKNFFTASSTFPEMPRNSVFLKKLRDRLGLRSGSLFNAHIFVQLMRN